MAKNSRVIMAQNIKMDRNYKNVINYTEQQMVTLCENNVVAQASNFTFIRDGFSLLVPFTYSQCLSSNYIAFQNPSYSNKWFFAWIDKVTYKNDATTQIDYTIDIFSTWFSYVTPKTCLVIREHVSNDGVGVNTVPEGLETGEYICNSHVIDDRFDNIVQDMVYVFACSKNPYETDEHNKLLPTTGGLYNGIYQGNTFFRCDTKQQVQEIIESVQSHGEVDIITGLFMVPKELAQTIDDGAGFVLNSNSPVTYNNSISKQTTVNGFTPKNKKLLCYPYNYLIGSNNNGASYIYHYEDFSTSTCDFKIDMAITPGCSIRMIPKNYKGIVENDECGINMGKLPICSYNCDMYINWLTQNSVNIGGHTVTSDDVSIGSSLFSMIGSALTGNIGGTFSSMGSNVNALISQKQHELIPPQVRGNTNCGDVISASNKNNFHFYKMSIKQEYARILDDYFTRYGYKVNRLKTPNITGRTYFNYVQIGSDEVVGTGTMENSYMDTINKIFRSGVTIWHSHENMYNYSLDNSI